MRIQLRARRPTSKLDIASLRFDLFPNLGSGGGREGGVRQAPFVRVTINDLFSLEKGWFLAQVSADYRNLANKWP